jgi:hypothetical protein
MDEDLDGMEVDDDEIFFSLVQNNNLQGLHHYFPQGSTVSTN